jgi:hypothetical protein
LQLIGGRIEQGPRIACPPAPEQEHGQGMSRGRPVVPRAAIARHAVEERPFENDRSTVARLSFVVVVPMQALECHPQLRMHMNLSVSVVDVLGRLGGELIYEDARPAEPLLHPF